MRRPLRPAVLSCMHEILSGAGSMPTQHSNHTWQGAPPFRAASFVQEDIPGFNQGNLTGASVCGAARPTRSHIEGFDLCVAIKLSQAGLLATS